MNRVFLKCFMVFIVVCIIFSIYLNSKSSCVIWNKNKIEKIEIIAKYCYDQPRYSHMFLRDKYWVLQNYIPSKLNFKCDESITLTANADYTFLDNVIPALEHWRGPISLAVYAPGEDFVFALESIAYLRNCESQLVVDLVTFHLILDSRHLPRETHLYPLRSAYKDNYNCSLPPPYNFVNKSTTYRTINELHYPINLARNIAIQTSQTHFIFPLDIELYPSKNFIKDFLDMINRNNSFIGSNLVYVLPHFEIEYNAKIPSTKAELRSMVKNRTAFWFHQKLCSACHKIPFGEEWLEMNETEVLDVFKYTKRHGHWEPFFVSTRAEPLFDERFTWEGQSNKMSQGYALCLLDYDYAILNNAFLVHKPGVKKEKEQLQKFSKSVSKTRKMIKKLVKPEMNILYGKKELCKF